MARNSARGKGGRFISKAKRDLSAAAKKAWETRRAKKAAEVA